MVFISCIGLLYALYIGIAVKRFVQHAYDDNTNWLIRRFYIQAHTHIHVSVHLHTTYFPPFAPLKENLGKERTLLNNGANANANIITDNDLVLESIQFLLFAFMLAAHSHILTDGISFWRFYPSSIDDAKQTIFAVKTNLLLIITMAIRTFHQIIWWMTKERKKGQARKWWWWEQSLVLQKTI